MDSSSSSGLTVNGNVSISAPTIGVVGNYTKNGNSTLTPTPKTGVIAASDPLAYVKEPTVGSCAHTNFSLNGNIGSSGSPYQLYPGTYCGGISVNGNSWLHFNAGTYVIAGGGMNINGNSTMTGTGVTFYNTTGTGGYGAITLNGNSQANFSAPTSGPLAGILFFQDRAIPGTRGRQHNKRKLEFDLRRRDLLRDDHRQLQRQQQRQRLQHRGRRQAGAKRQRVDRQ